MYIKRLRVEEGFFDGLDIVFAPGLNVLIGGRGVGKTSIIELIRYGLDININSSAASAQPTSHSHALSILKSGQVTIDLDFDGSLVTVTRSASDAAPQYTSPFSPDAAPATIFSQKEIESIGFDARGRLSLIDGFVQFPAEKKLRFSSVSAAVRTSSAQIISLRREIEELKTVTAQLPALREAEVKLMKDQASYAAASKEIAQAQISLGEIQKTLSDLTIEQDDLIAYEDELERWSSRLNTLSNFSLVREGGNQNNVLQSISKDISSDIQLIKGLQQRAQIYVTTLANAKAGVAERRRPLEDRARELRQYIERTAEGAGKVARELGLTQEKIAKVLNVAQEYTLKNIRVSQAYEKCLSDLVEMYEILNEVFSLREMAASALNAKLSPKIKIEVSHLSRLYDYELAIKDALKGSNIKYNELSSEIASKISPAELLEILRDNNFESFSEITGISRDRAARVVGYLSEVDVGGILTAPIYDDVQFFLMDGSCYKPVHELSIGQRCTITLSLALENLKRPLIIDQPEDHLDNEFIAETLIQAIIQRNAHAQTILSSHNANIPVLGNAEFVVHLDSNGRSGYVASSGLLNTAEIVNSIESIMEGGEAAFVRRAEFYGVVDAPQ